MGAEVFFYNIYWNKPTGKNSLVLLNSLVRQFKVLLNLYDNILLCGSTDLSGLTTQNRSFVFATLNKFCQKLSSIFRKSLKLMYFSFNAIHLSYVTFYSVFNESAIERHSVEPPLQHIERSTNPYRYQSDIQLLSVLFSSTMETLVWFE